MNKSRRFDKTATNVCKGLAIILMYIHHSFCDDKAMRGVTVKPLLLNMEQLMNVAIWSRVCVSIFVFLTAFGVYRSVRQHPYQLTEKSYRVVWKRYISLLTHFMLIFILVLLTAPLTGMGSLSTYQGEGAVKAIWYFLADALGLAKAFKTPTLCATWWYMPLAYMLIFLMPLLVCLTDRIGTGILVINLLMPSVFGVDPGDTYWRYSMAVSLGLVFAKYDIPERVRAFCMVQKWDLSARHEMQDEKPDTGMVIVRTAGSLLVTILLAVILVICRDQLSRLWLFEGLLAADLCVFCFLSICSIKALEKVFALLGRYSMYMFLFHTFIRGNQSKLHQLSYAPKQPVLIILLLLADTLVIAVIIDVIYRLIAAMTKHIFRSPKTAG